VVSGCPSRRRKSSPLPQRRAPGPRHFGLNGGSKEPVPPSNLQTPDAGQFSLNDWLGQSNNSATVKGIETDLRPVMEMMPFQRKIRTAAMVATVGVGQIALFQRKVPRNEIWRLHFVSIEHNDAGNKNVRLSILQDISTTIIYNITRRSIDPNIETPLYPSVSQDPIDTDLFDQRGGPAPELIGGDTLQVIQIQAGTNAGRTWNVTLRYEILPAANEAQPDNDFVITVV